MGNESLAEPFGRGVETNDSLHNYFYDLMTITSFFIPFILWNIPMVLDHLFSDVCRFSDVSYDCPYWNIWIFTYFLIEYDSHFHNTLFIFPNI